MAKRKESSKRDEKGKSQPGVPTNDKDKSEARNKSPSTPKPTRLKGSKVDAKQTTKKQQVSSEDSENTKNDDETKFEIVAIGASAGALAALKLFFAHVPDDSGLAFVIVVHLSPEYESHLAEVLQPFVAIPVQQVSETTKLEANRVYVIPPNANLESIDTHLRLTELEKRRQERAPIDHFFRTLSVTHDGDAIGVVLTGTGSDGTLGLRDVKARGGLTIVQDPTEAEFDGMPQSAVATGLVDLVLPLASIPAAILEFVRVKPRVPIPTGDENPPADVRNILQEIFAQLRTRTGRDFSQYKLSTVLRRISRRMQFHHKVDLNNYVEVLRRNPAEVALLADDLLINVTNFFRDQEVFERLEKTVIPEIIGASQLDRPIRIWSVGCATGEEAYSLAILLLEAIERSQQTFALQVFATDLHEHSLAKAREGFYPGDIETDVSPGRLQRFFVKEDSGYRIRKEVREAVIFAPHNLLNDPPFSNIDLVTCRNLLIYLKRDIQHDVIALFHYALRPDAYLLLGTSETLEVSELFRLEDKPCCLYRKRNVPGPEPRLPVFPLQRSYLGGGKVQGPFPREQVPIAYGAMHQQMVEQLAPPSMLVSPDDKVVHLSANVGRYLIHPGGEITASAYKLVRQELQLELRAIIQSARENSAVVRTPPIAIQFDGKARSVVIHGKATPEPQREGYVLIIFEEHVATQGEEPGVADHGKPHSATARELKLGGELNITRQRLQAIIEENEASQEELKASNEELQSANEELRSTLEELETSKEELQSMNEELQTVNQENLHKVEELALLSNDLQNLLAATDIATLFLDREFRILRFTPKVTELFNVRLADRGRTLADFTHRLGYPHLLDDACRVLDRLVPVEREMQDEAGRWYLTRILPYRSAEDRIEGVVATFIEISTRKHAELALRENEERYRLLVESAKEYAIIMLDSAGRVATWNSGAERIFGYPEAQVVGQSGDILFTEVDRGAGVPEAEMATATRHGHVAEERWQVRKDGSQFWASGVIEALFDGADAKADEGEAPVKARGFVKVLRDNTEQRETEEALRRLASEMADANRRKDEFLAMLSHELRNPLAPIRSGLELMKLAENFPESLIEVRAILENQTLQLIHLVDDLLDVSRVTRGKLKLRKSAVVLQRAIQSSLEATQSRLTAGGQELIVDLPDEPCVLYADASRLAQVFTNLLANAIKYTPAGGTIWLTAVAHDDEVLVTVADTGVGIPNDVQDDIFEMFTQIGQGEAKGESGLGIGLTLVRSIVVMHGGSVGFESPGENLGTKFHVRLPLQSAAEAGQRDLVEQSVQSTPAQRILIVDDNYSALKLLSMSLEQMGHDLRTAQNGEEAVKVAAEFRPSIVFMDLGMPVMDGYRAAKVIRAQAWGNEMVLIALTGWGADKDKQKTLEAGFDLHLVKPVEHGELLRALHKAATSSRNQ